ncbi:alpha/beta hydrolase [Nocardia sp. MW-W600-9]
MLATLDAGFPDIATMRAAEVRAAILARRAPLKYLPEMRAARDVVIAGPGGELTLRVYQPYGSGQALPVIVFAHGGGFVFCDLDSHDEFCRSMAAGVGAVVVAVDYRLAPEHPGPAAHEDVLAALRWVAEHAGEYGGDPARIALAGDSAGGNLAATVAIAVRDGGGPTIAAQILFYPVIDDDFETESYQRFGTGHYNTTSAMRWYWRQYAPHGTDDVRLVPTRAESLAGLPPAVVITAELDPPCSAGDAYARRLADDGVTVRHRRYDGLFHGFLTIPSLAATAAARTEIWAMTREVLGTP